MDSAGAAATLKEIEGLQRSTNSLLDASWFPLVLWGLIVIGSAPFTQVNGGDAVGFYWMLAGPIGVFVTFLYFRGHELDLGLVDRQKAAYIVTSLSIAIGSMALGFAGQGNMLSAVGPVFVVAAGLAVFAALDHSRLLAAASASLGALGLAVLLADPSDAVLWAVIGEGLILVLTGVLASRSAMDDSSVA